VEFRADDLGGRLCFLQPHPANLRAGERRRASLAAGHDGDVDFATTPGQKRQRPSAHKLYVVGMTSKCQNALHIIL
jgi:hypothetical protein